MTERTRLPTPGLTSAEVFARYVQDWMGCFGTLVEATSRLRLDGTEPDAVSALLDTLPLRRLSASWEIWEIWTGTADEETDRLLAPYLGTESVKRIRFALWGPHGTHA